MERLHQCGGNQAGGFKYIRDISNIQEGVNNLNRKINFYKIKSHMQQKFRQFN
jgi:hypothetical protein